MTIARRKFLGGAVLAGAGIFAGLPAGLISPRQALAAGSLVYGAHPDVSPLVLMSRDWPAKYDLDVKYEYFSSGGPADKALIAGDIDLDGPGGGRAISLQAAAEPGEYSLIMPWVYGDAAATVVRPDSSYQTMADLKGKKVGAVVGSGAYMAWVIWLDAKGMSVDDFEVINMQGGQIASALSAGSIEGATIWEPFPATMEQKGIGKILQLFSEVVYDSALIQTRRDVIENKRDELVRFTAAAMDVQDWIRENPTDAAKAVAKGMTERGAGDVSWETFDAMMGRLIFKPDMEAVEPSLNKIADVAYKLGKIRTRPELSIKHDILADAKDLRQKG